MRNTVESLTSDFCPAGEGAGRTEEAPITTAYIKFIAPQPDGSDPQHYEQWLEDRKYHGTIEKRTYPLEPNQEIVVQQ